MAMQPFRSPVAQTCPSRSTSPGASDPDLLDRFVRSQDEAAFELLVRRHGPMVQGVCWRVLGDAHDAEDSFQATFLALARKAGSIGHRESVAAWLYKVAYHVALRVRTRRARRSMQALPAGDLVADPGPGPDEVLAWRELGALFDTEVNRLPEKYRTAFVLCYFQGKTNEAAAEELGCPHGTILSRLARARERLRKRLGQRGVALASAPFALVLAHLSQKLMEVSPVLIHSAVQAAVLVPVARLGAALSGGPAAELADGVLREFARAWRLRVAVGLALLLLLGGSVAVAASGLMAGERSSSTSPDPTTSAPATFGGCHAP